MLGASKRCGLWHPIFDAGCGFETVYRSPAARAQLTIEIIRSTLFDFDVHIDDALYTFDAGALLYFLQNVRATVDECVAVDHNPAPTALSNYLSRGDIE